MERQRRDYAVVLGGSMAGLLAARVLAESYTDVTVIDRDELTGVTSPRRGVPHGRHAHGLLALGQQILEEELPGLTADLIEAGVRTGDLSGDIRWYFNGRRLRPSHTGLVCVPATRPVLEHHVRMRVRAIPNVTFAERCDVLGLEATAGRDRITGVRVRWQAGDGAEETEEVMEADLVVDATGRGSRTPAWLEELGYSRPGEERVKIGLAYTTRHYRLSHNPFGTDLGIIPVATPAYPRGAFFYPLPGDRTRAELSLTGILGDHPPTDPGGFLAYVRSLPVPEIFEAVRDAEPLDDPVTFRFPVSVRRRYERLTRFPTGLLAIGDAVCSFNPVYGQGMTAAAIGAATLRRRLREEAQPQPRRFFHEVAAALDAPWEISATSDLSYPEVVGRRTLKVRLINTYMACLQAAAVHDPSLTTALIRALGLIDSPMSLMRPDRVLRVLRNSRRRPGGRGEQRAVNASARPAD